MGGSSFVTNVPPVTCSRSTEKLPVPEATGSDPGSSPAGPLLGVTALGGACGLVCPCPWTVPPPRVAGLMFQSRRVSPSGPRPWRPQISYGHP